MIPKSFQIARGQTFMPRPLYPNRVGDRRMRRHMATMFLSREGRTNKPLHLLWKYALQPLAPGKFSSAESYYWEKPTNWSG